LSLGGAKISLQGYEIIGKLRIEKIGMELPVLSQTTARALKVSICYYGGAKPGEKGNMIITGHNYRSGAHFGKLDQLSKGGSIIFNTPGGKVYIYDVVGMQTVKPDDLEALNEYQEDYTLTLVTCASSGNRRLLVRCRLVSH
jgi:sortase A